MSKARVKKAIAEMDKDGLAEMVLELYAARPEAKEYLDYWADPDPLGELERYKEKAYKLYFMSAGGRARKKPAAASVKQLLKNFHTLTYDAELMATFRIYICEVQYDWLKTRTNIITPIKAIRAFLSETKAYLESAGLLDLYQLRIDRMEERLKELEEDNPAVRRRRRWGWGW